ncbi:MAG TPA: TIGR02281 family clan AA aspartic protease [Croceibacterium sp.]|nr:TIGR02281 family clan AA aspartic protease [Croceibacterium sp.]
MRFTPFVFVTLLFGALVGWFAPGASQPGAAAAGAAVTRPDAQQPQAADEHWYADEVVLPRGGDGHFYAQVSTASGSVMMLVDTGATMVALTGNDAAMMGVEWQSDQVRPVARGASGDVYGVPVVLDAINVNGIEARRVPAVVVPEGLDISLLGQSFLSRVNRVEVTSDEMVLHD